MRNGEVRGRKKGAESAPLVSCLGQQVGVAKRGDVVVEEAEPGQVDGRGLFVSRWSHTDQVKRGGSLPFGQRVSLRLRPPCRRPCCGCLTIPQILPPLGRGWCVTLSPPPGWQGCAPRFLSFGRGGEMRFQTGLFSTSVLLNTALHHQWTHEGGVDL